MSPVTVPSPTDSTLAFALAMQSALSLDDVAATFLDSVHQLIQAESYGLYRLHAGTQHVLDVHAQVEGELLQHYEQSGRDDDPVLAHVLEHHQPFDSSKLSQTRWRQSGAHAVLKDSGLEYSLEAPILVDGTVVGTINFARSTDMPAFSEQDLRVAATVAEHLGAAIRRARHVDAMTRRSMMLEAALDRVSDIVVLTDLTGQVQYLNRRADDVLVGLDDAQPTDSTIGMALASASELIGSGDKRVVMQDIDIPDASYVARTIRLPDCAKAMMTTLHPRTPSPARLPVWSVLTTREQEIAELASEGLTTRAIAQRAFISENTVKQHLKRIFAKTDVNSRAELVQLIWATTHSEQTPAAAMAG